MKPKILFLLWILILFFNSDLFAADKIKIVATTSTFASIAHEITQDKAEFYWVASPNQNIHFIAPTPKDVLKTKKADVFIHGGLDLETWRDPLLHAAGKKEFITGERAIDVSKDITLLEVPDHDHVPSRLEGDIHLFGNPHYWPSPENAKQIASTMAKELSKFYPEYESFFTANLISFNHLMEGKIKDWKTRMAPFKGQKVVTYHNSWLYFLNYFDLKSAAYLEPKPGIPPTAKHLQSVMKTIREDEVKIIIRQNYEDSRSPQKIAQVTGAKVVTLFIETGQIKGDFFDLIERNIEELEKAFSP